MLNFTQGGLGTNFFSYVKFEVTNFLEFFNLQSTVDAEFFTGASGNQFFWSL